MRYLLAFIATAFVAVSGCATSVEVQPEAADSSTTTTRPEPTSSTTAAPTRTDAPAAPAGGSLDWDGVAYDYGHVVSATADAGGTVVVFDRWQVYLDERGLVDAKSMTSEPIVAGNSDEPGQNASTQTRSYRVAPGAELLTLANVEALCDYDSPELPEPQWAPFTTAALLAGSVPGIEQHQTALTFDSSGQVSRIRVSSSC